MEGKRVVEKSSESPPLSQIVVVTGSRAEFGLLEPTLTLLRDAPWCNLSLFVAGMHLVPELGHTVELVEARFPVAARIEMAPKEDSPAGMALSVADGLRRFTEVLEAMMSESIGPDLLLVLGDRTEPFAASLAHRSEGRRRCRWSGSGSPW